MQTELACQGALKILSEIDDKQKETQAVALGLTLLAYSHRHNVPIGDIFTVANNMLGSNQIKSASFDALQAYIQYEL